MAKEYVVGYPWRRFLARLMDYWIYSFLWLFIQRFVFGANLAMRGRFGFLHILTILFLMLLVEPVLLHRFGTTAGKKLLGISVKNLHGHKLPYWEALYRTWGVMGSGLGYGIPIFNIYKLWKSYKRCADRKMQPWDVDISYSINEFKWYRGIIYAGVSLLLGFAMVLTIISPPLPPNRGDLTIEEFAENFNYYSSYYQVYHGGRSLSVDGQWDPGSEQDVITLSYPEFYYRLDDGHIKEVGFELDLVNQDKWISAYDDQMILATLSFVGAQQNIILSRTREKIIKRISGNSFQSFEFEKSGITVTNDVEYSGYLGNFPVLVPDESSEETHFWMLFRMQKR